MKKFLIFFPNQLQKRGLWLKDSGPREVLIACFPLFLTNESISLFGNYHQICNWNYCLLKGAQVKEFCTHGTKDDCRKAWISEEETCQETWNCHRLHFRKIIQSHTDETLGDCSFLNTCFHMETCKYVHYEVDAQIPKLKVDLEPAVPGQTNLNRSGESSVLYPAQWIQCDLRSLDMGILGKWFLSNLKRHVCYFIVALW